MIDKQSKNIQCLEGNNHKPILLVKTVTWTKDTHSLFDYEFTKNIVKEQNKIILQPGFIFMYRQNSKSEIAFVRENQLKPKQMDHHQLLGCFQICGKDKKFKLQFHQPNEFHHFPCQNIQIQQVDSSGNSNQNQPAQIQRIFFIVRSFKDSNNQPKGYKLAPHQTLKIGRVQFNVMVKYHDQSNACPTHEEQQYFDYEETMNANDIQRQEGDVCKICLSNEQHPGGYFFCRACQCSGSVSLVHFSCLYMWCETKIKKQNQGIITHYNFNKFYCELCKAPYPRYLQKDGIKHDLMPVKKPQKTHLSLLEIKENSLQKRLMIIEYNDNVQLKIGRNHECQIRSTDISISRKHGLILMKNNNFYIFDTKSKFGTLICEPNLHLSLEVIKRGIQVGRTVATFELKSNITQ